MNNNWILFALVLGGLFFLRRNGGTERQRYEASQPGLIGVDTSLPGYSGFDPDSQLY